MGRREKLKYYNYCIARFNRNITFDEELGAPKQIGHKSCPPKETASAVPKRARFNQNTVLNFSDTEDKKRRHRGTENLTVPKRTEIERSPQETVSAASKRTEIESSSKETTGSAAPKRTEIQRSPQETASAAPKRTEIESSSKETTDSAAPKRARFIEPVMLNHQFVEYPIGRLANCGNTCYINSVLYSLRFIPCFLHNLHYLIQDLLKINNTQISTKVKSSSLGRQVSALAGPNRSSSSKDLLQLENDALLKSTSTNEQMVAVRLHEVYSMLRKIEETRKCGDPLQPFDFIQSVRDANRLFHGNEPQDAHEFFSYLLEYVNDTCEYLTKQARINPRLLMEDSDDSASTTKKQSKNKGKRDDVVPSAPNNINVDFKTYNFISDYFGGAMLARITCLECESVTERRESFYNISVPIIDSTEEETASSVFKRACVTSEKLCGANKYLCEECGTYSEARRDVRFILPCILVMQLKRFAAKGAYMFKDSEFMPTPLRLDCFCYECNEKPSHFYELNSVIMHVGQSIASGHYIAYVRVSNSNCCEPVSNPDTSLNFFRTIIKGSGKDKNKLAMRYNLGANCRNCCAVKPTYKSDNDTVWLECDDDNVKTITCEKFESLLNNREEQNSTPYLLFYTKMDV